MSSHGVKTQKNNIDIITPWESQISTELCSCRRLSTFRRNASLSSSGLNVGIHKTTRCNNREYHNPHFLMVFDENYDYAVVLYRVQCLLWALLHQICICNVWTLTLTRWNRITNNEFGNCVLQSKVFLSILYFIYRPHRNQVWYSKWEMENFINIGARLLFFFMMKCEWRERETDIQRSG
jgi:hypothetical protein